MGALIAASIGGASVLGTPRGAVLDAVLAGSATAAEGPTCEVSETLVNSCRPWLGASANKYPQVAKGLRAQVEYHEQRIGKQLDIVHAYNAAITSGLSADELYFAARPNTILFLNWKPVDLWAQANGSNETVNANIDSYAASIKSLGTSKILLTLHHEPENDVSGAIAGCSINGAGSSGTTDDYRAMWRNVRERFDALGVTNVVWAMDYTSQQSYGCMMDDLYPGNDLVDWIFFDNYGTGQQHSFEQNVGRMYDLLRNTSDAAHDYLSKPWGIAEWNISKGMVTQQQIYDYYDEAKAELETNRFPRIKAYLVYDSNVNGAENRIMYKSKGVVDALRQEHYAAFAHSPAFAAAAPPEADTIAPSPPAIQRVTANGNGASVNWLASTDNVLLSDYEIFRDGQFVGSSRDTSFLDLGAAQLGKTYSYAIRAIDSAENASEFSDSAEVTVTDITAPTTPGTPSAVLNVDDSVTVSWGASTDDMAMEHYEIWRDGSFLTASVDVTFTDSTTRQGQTYSYTVYAVDAVGNRSSASAPATIAVLDRIAPSAPTSLLASSPAKGTVRLTWKASTDNVGVKGYYVYRGSTLIATLSIGTASSYTVKNLASGQINAFSVLAFDAAGNQSGASNSASVKVR